MKQMLCRSSLDALKWDAGCLVHLDQALSLTAGSELTTAIAEEITGSISL